MPKVKMSPLFNSIKGSIGGMTIVNRKDGTHARKKRSTSDINEVLQKSAEAMRKAIPYAQSIYWAFEPYRKDVTAAGAWNKLRHVFKDAILANKPMDYTFLKGFQFQEKVGFKSMADARFTSSQHAGMLRLSVECNFHFPKELKMDGFKITIVPVIACAATKTAEVPGACEFMVDDIKQTIGIYKTEMAVPVQYDAIVVAVKVEGYKEGKTNNQKVNNMMIVGVVTP